MHANCPSIDTWHASVPRNAKPAAYFGIGVLLVWGLGFGLWAGFAPIDGAVVAPGSFVATGENKHIQHLEGGIVRDILVHEGQLVEKGDVLIRLDDTVANAKVKRLNKRYYQLLAMQARLRAEARFASELVLPPELLKAVDDPNVATMIALQKDELDARQTKIGAEIEVLNKEIAGINETIAGYKAQVAATDQQLKLFRQERADKEELLKRSLVRRTDVLALQRADARLAGDLGQFMSRIADSKERIARAEQQIAHIRSATVQRAIEELRGTEAEIQDINEQVRAARDVAARVEVKAPVRGIVVKLNQHTPGGVVGSGATIVELLPVNAELIIESRVLPSDISNVKEGQEALVRIAALNHRSTPMIKGKVVYVSADAVSENDTRALARLPNAAHGMFVLRIRLDEADLNAKAPDFQPTPGMPGDVFVKTGERTFFQYLMKPLTDSFSKAFREQ